MRATGAHSAPRKVRRKAPSATGQSPSLRESGQFVDDGTDNNALIRNKYVREDTGTHETLKILDDSLLEDEEEFGADPYNTGRFDRSKSWNSSRSRN